MHQANSSTASKQEASVIIEIKELVVIIRPSFMKFCQDGCKAAAFNHILYWIARKAKDQSAEEIQAGNVTWYATTEEITEGLAIAWSVEKVRQEVNALIALGIIGRGRNQQWGADRTKHFYFGKEQCAKLKELCQKHDIRIQQIGLCADVLSLLSRASANHEFTECKSQKRGMQNANSRNAQARPKREFAGAIAKDTTKVSNKEERMPDSPSLVFSPEEQFVYDLICQVETPPNKTETCKGHCAKLSPHVKTVQDMLSLWEFAKKRIPAKGNQQVQPGNMVNCLTPWLHTRRMENAGSIQQQLYDKEPDFPHKTQAELADMSLEERRDYARRANAYTIAKREQEERAQSEQQVPA